MPDSLLTSFGSLPPFLAICGLIGVAMLVWATIEVGRNDAANLINAVFGARILTRRAAIWVAGLGVVLGTVAAAPVVETARKGIFEPGMLTLEQAVVIYVAVYIVDTILLYAYSAFGMPVSTTACMVFALLGASLAVGRFEIVHWSKAGEVVSAIVLSIFISGAAGFLVQRAIRGAIRDRSQQLATLLLHGGWIGGGMLAGLCYFMLVKGMKNIAIIKQVNEELQQSAYGVGTVLIGLWVLFAVLIHLSLVVFRKRAAKWIFPCLAIVGTFCMGFAFGQNDLANCASPGLAILTLLRHWKEGVVAGSAVPISRWMLAFCGLLLLGGMMTKNAARVTRAQVHAGSMANNVALWAPRWCIRLARLLLRNREPAAVLAPPASTTTEGKTMHYDALRACTILGVSACVIATASGLGLPVSTTYVGFAAVIATGAADRIMQRGDADLKLARTIWVVFSWFAAAGLATLSAVAVCEVILQLHTPGIVIAIGANIAVQRMVKRRGDAQEHRIREQARDRLHPERYAEYED